MLIYYKVTHNIKFADTHQYMHLCGEGYCASRQTLIEMLNDVYMY